MLLFNGCGAIELNITSELYSIERFGQVDLADKGLLTKTFNRIKLSRAMVESNRAMVELSRAMVE